MLKIFIDTEFTCFERPQLISFGAAADNGETFYAELPFDYFRCSEFVHQHVIPLLNREKYLVSPPIFRTSFLDWLAAQRPGKRDIEICFDYEGDLKLLKQSLGGSLPQWCKPRHVYQNINKMFLWSFFVNHNLRAHHALNDAMANRAAFRER